MKSIYLDYNATTPIDREVAEAMTPYLYDHFGNPSSSHPFGTAARLAIESSRGQVASMLGSKPAEVIFTSGGTESNNFAIRGAALANRNRGNHIITSAVEHPAVIEVCRWLEEQGFRLSILPVDETGLVHPEDLEKAISADTILVTIMHANNEVGTIQPIAEFAKIAHQHDAIMHTDAAQSIGKIPVDVNTLGVDLLSVAGHKLYAPKGIGALYQRSGTQLAKLMFGANHEVNRRPGTENVLEIVGLGKASEIASRDLNTNIAHYQEMSDRLLAALREDFDETVLRRNGNFRHCLSNTLNVSFRGVEANTLLSEINDKVAASAGAACHAESVDVSTVLEAMRLPLEWAMGTLRFSVGRGTTPAEIDQAAQAISQAVQRLLPQGTFTPPVLDLDEKDIKLTHYTHGLGCACKLRPQALEAVLQNLPKSIDPSVLIGIETADDAAVYQISDESAIVQTIDFFTPIVDDPYWFGAISAANSLSDIYAMGARPLFALNIVGFPSNRLPLSVLERILLGAADKAAEAGISIIGGHTVDDTEPKYGLAVTGIVHPQQVLRNSTAQPGDVLVLTKPLGMGILATAAKRGLASEHEVLEAMQHMAALNRGAAEAMLAVGVNACTDVTGFGLLGHLHEMTAGSGMDAALSASAVPILDSARRLAGADVIPGGTRDNLAYVHPHVDFAPALDETEQLLLADAQTSGGLLISLPEARADELLAALQSRGIQVAAQIGRITGPGSGRIQVDA
jgi:cysteine desulfurase